MKTLMQSLMEKAVIGGPDDCWPWVRAKHVFGYGQLTYKQKHYDAHRLSYELHKGPIPKGQQVLHKCDNPPCINPAHLFLGSSADNVKDAAKKNRMHPGTANGAAKLDWTQAFSIRVQFYQMGVSCYVLAKQFGISVAQVRNIVTAKSWVDPSGPATDAAQYAHRAMTAYAGEKNGRAKVTQADVEKMRVLHDSQGLSSGKIAKLFGISESQALKIIKRRAW